MISLDFYNKIFTRSLLIYKDVYVLFNTGVILENDMFHISHNMFIFLLDDIETYSEWVDNWSWKSTL